MVHVLQQPWSKEPPWEERLGEEHQGIRTEEYSLGRELVGHLEHLEERLEGHSYLEGTERVGSLGSPGKAMEDGRGQEER